METDSMPRIADHGGYHITADDLQFLDIDIAEAAAMSDRQFPLGMDGPVYEEFVNSLYGALADEGITDADIRIQGSSVRFFSGKHKEMAWDVSALNDEYVSSRGGREVPSAYTLQKIARILSDQWPEAAKRPFARPFDVFFRAGVNPDKSDYDVQISSDQIVDKVRQQMRRRTVEPTNMRTHNPNYNFIKKEYTSQLAYLAIWTAAASELTGRAVTIAIFESSGPPEVSPADGPQSSHFQSDDWIISRANGAE